MPIPQLGLVETELMWRCLWDVAETQIVSELQAAQSEKSGVVINDEKDSVVSSGAAGDRGQGLKLGVGTGAGGGSAFYIVAKKVAKDGGSPVTVTVCQDYLSHYNLKCSREFLTEGQPATNNNKSSASSASSIRQADVNAAKMYFEVANGCSDSNTTKQQNSDSRPSTASSVSSSIPNKKSISLKASRNFSHELCRRFIRTVAEIIGEKGAKWDVHVEFPHFGLLRIKDRILDFTPAFSPKLMAAMGSSSSSGSAVGAAVVMSKPPLAPFGGGDTEEKNNDDGSRGIGGGGGSPLQRVLRQQARERMLLQKHGDSYIRARVDAKKNAAVKGGFNSAGIGAPHNVVDTSDTDSLFTIRPISKSGGGGGSASMNGGTQGTVAPSTTNNTAVADMKRLLISHRHMRPPSSSTTNNNTLPRVGAGGGRSSPQAPPSGAALVRSLDHQLQELRNQLSGPLESVECDLLAVSRDETSPTKQHQKDGHEGGLSTSPKKNRLKSSSSRATPIPALPTTRQLNFRHGQQQYARRSAKLMDNDKVQEQTVKARMYKQDLDLQNTISSTTKKSKKQLEIDADSRRIEIDVLTAAQNILVGLSDKKTMTAQMSVEAADIAKQKDLKHERDMLRRAGKRGKHHPQPKHIV